MTNILLISESYIKSNSEISENLWGQYLTPAIRTAQDIHLQSILGENLYNKILSLIENGDIRLDDYAEYKKLLDDFIQPYMIEQVITDLIPIVGSKIANLGTIHSKDEYVVTLDAGEEDKLVELHQFKADFYCRRMQKYLLSNPLPELSEDTKNKIKANLDSAASTGLWLGGVRGRKIK